MEKLVSSKLLLGLIAAVHERDQHWEICNIEIISWKLLLLLKEVSSEGLQTDAIPGCCFIDSHFRPRVLLCLPPNLDSSCAIHPWKTDEWIRPMVKEPLM